LWEILVARVLLITLFFLSLQSGLTQAARQEAECGASEITQALLDADPYLYFDAADSVVWQGWFRGIDIGSNGIYYGFANFYERMADDMPYRRWGKCIYNDGTNLCGGAEEEAQICWSKEPFTLSSTNNGETCEGDVPRIGILAKRDQTLYVISIDRSGAETEYCQIEFKTLATGEAIPSGPPGTGATSVVGLKNTDPETDETPDGPLVPYPGFQVAAIATPVMPHLVLIVLTGLLASIGVRHVRRRKAASLSA
jgi:hypothetical protein